MFMILELIDPSSNVNPETMPGLSTTIPSSSPGTTPDSTIPSTDETPVVNTKTAVIKTAHDLEDMIDRLAYLQDKEYKNSFDEMILSLDQSSNYLQNELSDSVGSIYFAGLSSILKDVKDTPFVDNGTFSLRVSDMLKRIDEIRPLSTPDESLSENEPAMYYPNIDTNENGSFVLAMLSVFQEQIKKNDTITVTFGPNLVLGDYISNTNSTFADAYAASNNPLFPIHKASGVFAHDDISIVNLEGTLTDSLTPQNISTAIKGLGSYANILKNNSIDVALLSSSHINDYGEKGAIDTAANLTAAGVKYADAKTIAYVDHALGKIAVLSYNISYESEPFIDIPKSDIAAAKSNGAKLVIVSFVWGNSSDLEYGDTITRVQVQSARNAIANGADLVLGCGPHTIQSVEIYRGKTIVYSGGDLSYAGYLDKSKASQSAFLFSQSFKISGSETTAGTLNVYPLYNTSSDGSITPTLLFDDKAEDIIDEIISHSHETANGIEKNDLSYIIIKK